VTQVTGEHKLSVIRAVLNVEYEHEAEGSSDGTGVLGVTGGSGRGSGAPPSHMEEARQMSTVFELAGQDRVGLLADVLTLFTDNGCDVRSAAVWTYKARVAVVVAVVQNQRPVTDAAKLTRLTELLHMIMDRRGNSIVRAHYVKGLIHFERRLHQLMLREEEKEWQLVKGQVLAAAGISRPHGHSSSGDVLGGDTTAAGLNGTAGGGNGLLQNGRPLPAAAGGSSSSGRGHPAGAPAGADSPSQQHPQQQLLNGSSMHKQQQQQQQGALLLQQQPAPVASQPASEVHMVSSAPAGAAGGGGSAAGGGEGLAIMSAKYSRPEVTIQHYLHLNYWMVTIKCKDRNKLFFDTVCTLSDLEYDVYHGAIDSEAGLATQLYYIRPRYGDFFWDAIKATKLRVMLEAAIQRRFPKGLKIHVQQTSQHCLRDLTVAWKTAGLWITRAKVRAYHETGHTLYVMDSSGQPPDPKKVYEACQACGGKLQEGWDGAGTPVMLPSPLMTPREPGGGDRGGGAAGGGGGVAAGSGANARFYFGFHRNWEGSPSSLQSA
jgi:hypothetical protein